MSYSRIKLPTPHRLLIHSSAWNPPVDAAAALDQDPCRKSCSRVASTAAFQTIPVDAGCVRSTYCSRIDKRAASCTHADATASQITVVDEDLHNAASRYL